MTDINELVQLRSELSNPAIGSKDHLRQIALSLVEALEKVQAENELNRGQLFIAQRTLLNQQRTIAELQCRTATVKLPMPACTYADHSYPAYSKAQVVELLGSIGVKLNEEVE